MWLTDLVTYTRAANLAGVGQAIFAYTLKENNVGAMFTSREKGILVDHDIPDYYKGSFQLIARANKPHDAEVMATTIATFLSSIERRKAGTPSRIDLASASFHYINPIHLPIVYPRSGGDFFEASVNFDICFVALMA